MVVANTSFKVKYMSMTKGKNNDLVSVIITTKNEEKNIGRLLESIKSQSYKNIETIVVDNPKTSDKTRIIAKKYTDKVYVLGPERSTQRNFAVKKASGVYTLILDADMVLGKDVIMESVQKIKSEKSKKIGAVIIPEQSYGIGFWAKTKALEREIGTGEEYFEAARFFPKSVFVEQGGYDTSLTGPEDWDLAQRIGKKYNIVRTESMIRHNEGRPTLVSLMKRKYYYGLSVSKYLKKHHLPVFSSRTVYFLRPGLYNNWRKLLKNPLTSLGMIIMLLAENVAGGVGFIKGKFKND